MTTPLLTTEDKRKLAEEVGISAEYTLAERNFSAFLNYVYIMEPPPAEEWFHSKDGNIWLKYVVI